MVQILEWLKGVRTGVIPEPGEFNWLGVAEAAAVDSRRGLDEKDDVLAAAENLEWAAVSVAVYEKLAQATQDKFSFEPSAMMLRAFFIAHLGVSIGHSILDPQILLDWFWNNLTLTLDEAVQKAAAYKQSLSTKQAGQWDDLEIRTLITLRHLKLRLSPIKRLVEGSKLKPDAKLATWLGIYSELP